MNLDVAGVKGQMWFRHGPSKMGRWELNTDLHRLIYHATNSSNSSNALLPSIYKLRLCVSANRGTGRGSQRSKQNPPGDSCRAHPPISPVAPRQGCGGQGQPWVSHNDVNVSPMAAILTMIQETVESMVHLSYIISYIYFMLQHVTTCYNHMITRASNNPVWKFWRFGQIWATRPSMASLGSRFVPRSPPCRGQQGQQGRFRWDLTKGKVEHI